MYKIPAEYFFRIHHVRPRFKNNIESVLIFMAEEIKRIGKLSCDDFKNKMRQSIKNYPGNITKKIKTIDNWRTEISILFGFYIEDKTNNITKPGQRAKDLSNNQDLVQFFKLFLYYFQYPGGHIKPHEVLKQIEVGIRFKPAAKILEVLKIASKISGKKVGINKAEATHIIFNDLRVTSELETSEKTAKRLLESKAQNYKYDWTGDVIRYAGDILDYMELANLIKSYNSLFYLNSLENTSIELFINSNTWFSDYDEMINKRSGDLETIKSCRLQWFEYVNTKTSDDFFMTDVFALLSDDIEEYDKLRSSYKQIYDLLDSGFIRTKEIGDLGEGLAYGHECKRIKLSGKEDLIRLIKLIPTALAVGYDLQSIEVDGTKRYIEVKTTVSSKNLSFFRFHLTANEWNTAKSLSDRYYVYRIYLSKKAKKLFILKNPESLYKKDKIDMTLNKLLGVEIAFNPEKSGMYEELLTWD
ncbi:MAG: DUF3883 domain-containing protein [Candidatus Marinimicrobia bacterium]|nr:DUF3883 domain-containing protein [Candidatus Neomarinimicrobiota bacterium]